MHRIRVVTFDCDGVMFDTETANRSYYNDILAHLGKPSMSDDQFAYAQMHTADAAIAHLFPDKSEFKAAQAYRRKRGYWPYISLMEMEPDLVDLLKWCRPRYPTAVATNRSDTMNRVLADHGIAGYFDLVVTALDVENPKPDPEVLIRVVDHFSVETREVIYIGDSSVDETAARGAGVVLAAYQNPKMAADYHIERLTEVKAILNGTHP